LRSLPFPVNAWMETASFRSFPGSPRRLRQSAERTHTLEHTSSRDEGSTKTAAARSPSKSLMGRIGLRTGKQNKPGDPAALLDRTSWFPHRLTVGSYFDPPCAGL